MHLPSHKAEVHCQCCDLPQTKLANLLHYRFSDTKLNKDPLPTESSALPALYISPSYSKSGVYLTKCRGGNSHHQSTNCQPKDNISVFEKQMQTDSKCEGLKVKIMLAQGHHISTSQQDSFLLWATGNNICNKTSLLGKTKKWRTTRIQLEKQTCHLHVFH